MSKTTFKKLRAAYIIEFSPRFSDNTPRYFESFDAGRRGIIVDTLLSATFFDTKLIAKTCLSNAKHNYKNIPSMSREKYEIKKVFIIETEHSLRIELGQ
jgi:hypothetical protein